MDAGSRTGSCEQGAREHLAADLLGAGVGLAPKEGSEVGGLEVVGLLHGLRDGPPVPPGRRSTLVGPIGCEETNEGTCTNMHERGEQKEG